MDLVYVPNIISLLNGILVANPRGCSFWNLARGLESQPGHFPENHELQYLRSVFLQTEAPCGQELFSHSWDHGTLKAKVYVWNISALRFSKSSHNKQLAKKKGERGTSPKWEPAPSPPDREERNMALASNCLSPDTAKKFLSPDPTGRLTPAPRKRGESGGQHVATLVSRRATAPGLKFTSPKKKRGKSDPRPLCRSRDPLPPFCIKHLPVLLAVRDRAVEDVSVWSEQIFESKRLSFNRSQ